MKKTICLTMIVKNEAGFISKSLQYIKDYIDYYVICDTGSTDGTPDIIKKTLRNIPGQILYHDWKDFSTNRNLSIEASKYKADYILIMDADDKFIIENKDAFKNLEDDIYSVKIINNNIENYKPILLKNSIDFKFSGIVYEQLNFPETCKKSNLEGLYIHYNAFKSFRNINPNKSIEDCKLLEKELVKDPNNLRNIFYLAQSYRDAGNDPKAIELYEKRAKMGGDHDEVFVSLFEIAKAKQKLKYPTFDIEVAYLKASYFSEKRAAESLYYLSRFFRIKENFNKSNCYAIEALKYKKPNSGLNIDFYCYKYKILDELAYSNYKLGNIEKSKKIYQKILSLDIPESEKLRFNMILKANKMQSFLDKVSNKSIK